MNCLIIHRCLKTRENIPCRYLLAEIKANKLAELKEWAMNSKSSACVSVSDDGTNWQQQDVGLLGV
jgi:hypothetical protein